MNIFVTVGHTHFNALFKAVDEQLSPSKYTIINQIFDGDYQPKKHQFFKFTADIESEIAKADLVITHAGAGSVFHLLELGKPTVVIPNFERIDEHQKDLADYVVNNNYACVCHHLAELEQCIEQAYKGEFTPYKKNLFNGYDRVLNLLSLNEKNNGVLQSDNITSIEDVSGIPVNLFESMAEAVASIITKEGVVIPGSAIAINPEKIIKARQDSFIKDILLSANIRFADGIGVVRTLSRKSGRKIIRIPGCELWEEVMKEAGQTSLKVFLIGAQPNVIEQTKRQLQSQYKVNICGIQDGYFTSEQEDELVANLSELKPDIVSIALGSPRQEILINRCRQVCPDTFFMGVGGTYDVYTNNVKRAPKVFRALNLEWFYRLASQPTRVGRQGNLLKYLYLELTRRL